MQIAVFGGAFDPPHLGHSAIAEYLLESGKAEAIWFLPVKIHAFTKQVGDVESRLAMLELMVAGHQPSWQIQPYELGETTTNYTYRTLCHFKSSYANDTFSFVIGADNLAKFPQWYNYQALLNEFEVLVYPRTGYSFGEVLPGMIPLTEAPEVSMSSTDIRQKVQAGESIAGLVLPEVEQYIKTHGLYTK